MFSAVSRKVSPLTMLEELPEMEMTSALRREAAISNATRVRVLGSRKRLTMVRPRSEGTFFWVRSSVVLNCSAVVKIHSISSHERSSMPRRSLRVQCAGGERGAAAVMVPVTETVTGEISNKGMSDGSQL